jgi:branched-chain amino acid transport system ATP-binding protein
MEPILKLEGVTVRFGGLDAVKNVSMQLREGEIRGLIGPNGAGKSTLFNAVSGIVPTTDGRVVFRSKDVSGVAAPARSASGIRRTFQSVQLIQDFTVLENVLIGMHSQIVLKPLDFLRLWGRNKGEAEAVRRVQEVLDYLGLSVPLGQEVRTLSFADQRFIEIARALVTHPTLLMLDEPAAGLSPPEIERFAALVRRLRTERNMTILLVEHVIALVMNLCDRVSVLDNGVLIAEDEPRRIADDPRVRTAYLGEQAHA